MRIPARCSRGSPAACLSGVLLSLACSPVGAQQLYGFGDSLLDTGRVCDKVGFPSGEYGTCSDGRGTMQWLPEYTGYRFDRANNLAEGGAGTGSFNIATLILPGAKGASSQVEDFLAAGRRIGADDLVIHSAGPNNRFLLGPLGPLFGDLYDPTLTPEGLATRSLAEIAGNVEALIGAGARNLVVYGGRAREVAGASDDQRYFAAMNAGIAGTLAPLGAEGTRIRILDFQSVYLRAIQDPAAYGLSTPFLYSDGTHPTEEGHRLLAQYVARLAATADGIPAQLDTVQAAGNAFVDALFDVPAAEASGAQRWRAFLRPVAARDERDAWQGSGGSTLAHEADTHGLLAGLGYRARPGLELGLVLGTARSETELDADWGELRADSHTLQGWLALERGALRAELALGWLEHRLDNRRRGVIDTLESDPDGDGWQASARLAWLRPWCGLRSGPLLEARYGDTAIGSHVETGDDILAQRIDEQSRERLDLGIGWRVESAYQRDAWRWSPRVEATLNADVLADSREVRTAAVLAPEVIAESRIDDDERDDPWLGIAAGLRLDRASGLAVQLGARLRLDGSGEERWTAVLGLEQGF